MMTRRARAASACGNDHMALAPFRDLFEGLEVPSKSGCGEGDYRSRWYGRARLWKPKRRAFQER